MEPSSLLFLLYLPFHSCFFRGESVLVVAPLNSAVYFFVFSRYINFAINYFAIKMYEILQHYNTSGGGRE